MSGRFWFIAFLGLGVFGVLAFLGLSPSRETPETRVTVAQTSPPLPLRKQTEAAVTPDVEAAPEESHLADALALPETPPLRDVAIVEDLLTAWRTAFKTLGNPVGDNAEITAALAGDNERRIAFLPRNHPAINRSGELCDRWGTPFRFHALSGTRMEVSSAGPDRRFGTDDDLAAEP